MPVSKFTSQCTTLYNIIKFDTQFFYCLMLLCFTSFVRKNWAWYWEIFVIRVSRIRNWWWMIIWSEKNLIIIGRKYNYLDFALIFFNIFPFLFSSILPTAYVFYNIFVKKLDWFFSAFYINSWKKELIRTLFRLSVHPCDV